MIESKGNFELNPNLDYLLKCHAAGIRGVNLQGSSRSGKTWSFVDFLIIICRVFTNLDIVIIRGTYASFKTSLFNDLKNRLPQWGIFDAPFGRVKNITEYTLFGNKISFIGASDVSTAHGLGSDIAFFNEATFSIPKDFFLDVLQRNRGFIVCDYNRTHPNHWVYELVNRENWGFLKTTFRDNPALSKNEKDTLLSYDPSNPINVERKTADARRWAIYGEGKDAMSDDMVITKWEHFTNEPASFDYVFYGLDFGYSKDPTALTKTWVNGKDIYCQLLLYEVGVDFKKIASFVDTDSMVFCDNDKISINELLLLNICAVPAKKGAFSIIRGVNFLNNHNLYIKDLYVENLVDGIGGFAFESELLSYHYKKTNAGVYVISNGNKVPTDKNNHAIDSWRYSVSNIYENN